MKFKIPVFLSLIFLGTQCFAVDDGMAPGAFWEQGDSLLISEKTDWAPDIMPDINTQSDNETVKYKNTDGVISIGTDSVLDMNLNAALDMGDFEIRPAAVTLPFLKEYPIDDLEIKLNVLKVQF